MKIAVIAHSYPTAGTPTAGTFVQVIARGLAAAGHNVAVVAPVPWPRSCKRDLFPAIEQDSASAIKVYHPSYLTFTSKLQFPRLGAFNPARWTLHNFSHAAIKQLERIDFHPDVVYGHFLYFGGGGAIEVAKHFGAKSFIGVGEGELWSIRPFGVSFARRHLAQATRIIPNATHLADLIHETIGVKKEKLIALPNGVDPSVFYPRDRQTCRRKYGISDGAFVVGAVGNYNFKKGICRVGEAMDGLQGVVGIFAGSGDAPPRANNVIFSKRVLHSELPEFYSACDVFVLPTLIEGCCNAIIEAMACGLPIISANTKYTSDLIDDTCAIRTDPLDVQAIRKAIIRLRDDAGLRARMAQGALVRAKRFGVHERTSKLIKIFLCSG